MVKTLMSTLTTGCSTLIFFSCNGPLKTMPTSGSSKAQRCAILVRGQSRLGLLGRIIGALIPALL
jgi:hypothetical protein